MFFEDRFHAAELLADRLTRYKDRPDAIILAIPRGALQIGYILARKLNLPLDVVLTKKIGSPGNPEFAIAATSRQGDVVIRDEVFKTPEWQAYIKEQAELLKPELDKKFLQYHPSGESTELKDKTVIIVDDGVATGNTLISAIELIKKQDPAKIVIALPVGPADTIKRLKDFADEVVCVHQPAEFRAIGQFYGNFEQVEDKQALELFNEANR